MSNTLEKLQEVIEKRRTGNPETSYVAQLFAKGRNKIAEKVSEEATETIIAAISEGKEETIYESADLLFHLSILWAEKGITPEEVMAELERRMNISGLDEKAARTAK